METNKTILLVEDNEIIRRCTKVFFERAGCQVIEVGTKKDAIESIQSQNFSLLLMDIGLPDGNGWEVISFARENAQSQNKEALIIVISAHISAQEKLENSQKWWINRCVEKPLRFDLITEILASMDDDNDSLDKRTGLTLKI